MLFRSPRGFAGSEALVMIRPQGIGLGKAETGIEGYVLDARFQGDDVRCSILFKGIEDPVIARIPSRHAPASGQTALFAVDSEHVLVFESQPQDTI